MQSVARLRRFSRCAAWTALVAVLCGWAAAPVAAQLPGGPQLPGGVAPFSPQGKQVVDVRIVGNQVVPREAVLRELQTRAGRTLSQETVEDDVRRLNRTRKFLNVQTLYQPAPFNNDPLGGVIVTFQLYERPVMRHVKYLGNSEIKTKYLEKEADLKPGGALDPFAIEEARRKMEQYYYDHGYAKASVTVIEGNQAGDKGVSFLINEGQKQRVWSVSFEGNTIVSDARLKTQIQSKPPIAFLFKGEVDQQKIQADVEKLTAYYRGLGYFRARVGRELVFNEAGTWADLRFVIDEGPQYKVRSVSFQGHRIFTTEQLAEGTQLVAGKPFNQADMNADLAWLRDVYGSQGYVFADIQADPRFLEEPGQLDLVYTIGEGKRYRVGRIIVQIKGDHPHTQVTTVLNRISLQPGDVCDLRELRHSERRLRASGLFIADPAQGAAPRIVFNPPDPNKPQRRYVQAPSNTVRSQSPDRPGPTLRQTYRPAEEEVLDLVVHGEWVPKDQVPPPPAERLWSAPGSAPSPVTSPVPGGPAQGGAVQGGAVQGGAVQGGAVQGGTVQGGGVVIPQSATGG